MAGHGLLQRRREPSDDGCRGWPVDAPVKPEHDAVGVGRRPAVAARSARGGGD